MLPLAPANLLRNPFPGPVNPCAELADEGTLRWARQFQILATESGYAQLATLRFGRLTGRIFPDADLAGLRLLGDWAVLLCVLDDRSEQQPADEKKLAAAHAEVLSAITGLDLANAAPRVEMGMPAQDGLLRAATDLQHRLRERAGSKWFSRFHERFGQCLESLRWGAGRTIERSCLGLRNIWSIDAIVWVYMWFSNWRGRSTGLRFQTLFGDNLLLSSSRKLPAIWSVGRTTFSPWRKNWPIVTRTTSFYCCNGTANSPLSRPFSTPSRFTKQK